MAPAQHGHKGALGVGFHASSLSDLRQTLVARAYWSRVHDIEVTHDDGAEFDPTSGRSVAEGVVPGDYDVRIKATLEGSTEGVVPVLARSLMGTAFTDTTVGTTGKQHTTQEADTMPLAGGRFSYESILGTAGVSEQGNGACTELGFNLDQAGYAKWNCGIIGSSPAYNASPTTPTLPSHLTRLARRKTTFTLDGAATHVVRNCNWNLKREGMEDDYDVASHQRRDFSYGEFIPTFDAEITFVNADNFRRFWGSATATVPGTTPVLYPVNIKTERYDVIPGGTAVHTAMLDMPAVKLTKVGTPIRSRDGIRQQVAGRGVYDGSTYAAKLTMINSIVSY